MQTNTASVPPSSLARDSAAPPLEHPPASNGAEPSTKHDLGSELPTYAHAREERQQQQQAPPPVVSRALSAAVGGSGVGSVLGTEAHRALETTKGKKWLNLFVKSRAGNAASLPVFFEGDVIAGRVELDLDKAEGYKGITVKVSTPRLMVLVHGALIYGHVIRPTDSRRDHVCRTRRGDFPQGRTDSVDTICNGKQASRKILLAFLLHAPSGSECQGRRARKEGDLSPPAEFYRAREPGVYRL